MNGNKPTLRVVLVAAIIVLSGVWLYFGPLAPEAGVSLEGAPRAVNVAARRFVLWELHADDSVRVVELLTHSRVEKDVTYRVCGQTLNSKDTILSQAWVGGKLVDEYTLEEVYKGKTYLRACYKLNVSASQYGYDMRIDHPPHLHVRYNERLISLGIEPKDYEQEIIAVAVPIAAHVKRVYDYQPYRHITLGEWDVFYYDTTKISEPVYIHIAYRLGDDAPPLDWVTVEASR